MDFQVQMVPGNDFTMEVSAPRGKENNVNKNIDIRCPPNECEDLWEYMERREGTKIFIVTFSRLILKATKGRQPYYLHSICKHLFIHSFNRNLLNA